MLRHVLTQQLPLLRQSWGRQQQNCSCYEEPLLLFIQTSVNEVPYPALHIDSSSYRLCVRFRQLLHGPWGPAWAAHSGAQTLGSGNGA